VAGGTPILNGIILAIVLLGIWAYRYYERHPRRFRRVVRQVETLLWYEEETDEFERKDNPNHEYPDDPN
jgi:hypothetical protein